MENKKEEVEMKQRVLFLCTHNSARSQMAEGLLRTLGGDRYEVYSAGTEATSVRPLATRAMAELGIDISQHTSKTLKVYQGMAFDVVITVCDAAARNCPRFPGSSRSLHWELSDPTQCLGTEEEQLHCYRAVRDTLRQRIITELLSEGVLS